MTTTTAIILVGCALYLAYQAAGWLRHRQPSEGHPLVQLLSASAWSTVGPLGFAAGAAIWALAIIGVAAAVDHLT